MKKIIAPLLAVFLIAAGVAAYLVFKPMLSGQKGPVPTDVLPAEPFVYVRLADLEPILKTFTATQFWQGIKAIDFRSIMEKTGATAEELKQFDNARQQLSLSTNQQLFMQFFGKEAAVAVYPVNLENFGPQSMKELMSHVFFVTRLKPEMQMAEFFSQFFSQFNKQVQSEDVPYKGYTIKIIKTDDGDVTVGYVRIKDYFVFGFGDQVAKTAIDVVTGTSKSLTGDPQFVKSRERFIQGSKGEIYVNFEMFAETIKAQVMKAAQNQEKGAMIQKQFEDTFRQMKGFQTLSYSWVPGDVSKAKMDFVYNEAELDPEIRQIYNCPARENATLKFVPDGVLAYQWSACYDMNFYYRQIVKEMRTEAEMNPDQPPPDQVIGGIEQAIHLSIEKDILPVLGDEIGGYLGRINTEGMFPVPELTIFVKIADQAKAEEVIKTLISLQPLFLPETETHGSTGIQFFMIPMAPNVVPSYAFVGNYLLVSTHKDAIVRAVDTFAGSGSPLTASAVFKSVDFGLTGKSNYVFFLHFGELMNEAVKLVDWGNSWAAQQAVRQQAFVTGTEKRLADLKQQIEKTNGELKSMRAELEKTNAAVAGAQQAPPPAAENTDGQTATTQAGQVDLTALISQKSLLEKRISLKEGELASSEGSVKDLEQMVQEYKQNAPNPEAREILVEQLAKPLLKSLAHFKVMGSNASFQSGAFESFLYWIME